MILVHANETIQVNLIGIWTDFYHCCRKKLTQNNMNMHLNHDNFTKYIKCDWKGQTARCGTDGKYSIQINVQDERFSITSPPQVNH